tara:strand:- start:208 stop:435 length:228 start_codon:yes stop_codon:yes gene_type:complete
MKRMNTLSVIEFLRKNGLRVASIQFSELFGELETVDHEGIKGFLHLSYGSGDDEYIFSKMKSEVVTVFTPELCLN